MTYSTTALQEHVPVRARIQQFCSDHSTSTTGGQLSTAKPARPVSSGKLGFQHMSSDDASSQEVFKNHKITCRSLFFLNDRLIGLSSKLDPDRMALQMTGGHANVVLAPSTKDGPVGSVQ